VRRVLGVLLALSLANAAHAGAWTRAYGSYYAKAGFDVYIAGNYTIGDRIAGEGQTYFGKQLNLYGEVGVLPWWPVQLVAQLPAVNAGTLHEGAIDFSATSARATTVRVGDLRVSLQTAVHPKLPLAVAIEAKIPCYANGRVGIDYGAAFQELFPLPGDGQVDLTGWFLAGASIENTPLWNDFAVGYRHRTEWFVGWSTDVVFVDGIAFGDTFGATLGRWTPMLRVDGIVNPKQDDVTRQYLAVAPQLLVDLEHGIALEARVSFDVWARNAAQGIGGGVGVSMRR